MNERQSEKIPQVIIEKDSGIFPREGTISEEEVLDTYQQANQAFDNYFDVKLPPGFVKTIRVQPKRHNNIWGTWSNQKKEIELSPFSLDNQTRHSDAFLNDPSMQEMFPHWINHWIIEWKSTLAHEMGHALLSQALRTSLRKEFADILLQRGNNFIAHETFPILVKLAYKHGGNSFALTKALQPAIARKPLLFEHGKILLTEIDNDEEVESDVAIYHYFKEMFGLSNLLDTISCVPHSDYPVLFYFRLPSYLSGRIDYGQALVRRFDRWLKSHYGFNRKELSEQAYRWYQDQSPQRN